MFQLIVVFQYGAELRQKFKTRQAAQNKALEVMDYGHKVEKLVIVEV